MRDLAAVMTENPALTIEGFDDVERTGFQSDRERLAEAVLQVSDAVAWLGMLPRTQIGRAPSHWLKHVAEDWAGRYIANGSLIAAALMIEMPIQRYGRLNAGLAVGAPARWPEEALPKSSMFWGCRRRQSA